MLMSLLQSRSKGGSAHGQGDEYVEAKPSLSLSLSSLPLPNSHFFFLVDGLVGTFCLFVSFF
jgi:hypothetical protein